MGVTLLSRYCVTLFCHIFYPSPPPACMTRGYYHREGTFADTAGALTDGMRGKRRSRALTSSLPVGSELIFSRSEAYFAACSRLLQPRSSQDDGVSRGLRWRVHPTLIRR